MGCLILYRVDGLVNLLAQVEVVFVELEVECLHLGKIEHIIYQIQQHTRLEEDVLEVILCLQQDLLLLLARLRHFLKLLSALLELGLKRLVLLYIIHLKCASSWSFRTLFQDLNYF